MSAGGDQSPKRLESSLCGFICAHHHHRAATIIDRTRVAGGRHPLFVKSGAEPAELFRGPAARLFVLAHHHRIALSLRNLDRDDFAVKLAVFLGGKSAMIAFGGKGVQFFSREGELLGRGIATVAHVAVVVGVPKPVVDHHVDDLCIAHPQAGASLVHKVRRVRHALESARDHDRALTEPNRLGGQHRRHHAAAADLVDRQARHTVRDSRPERGLACRGLTEAALEDATQNHLTDVAAADFSTAKGFSDRSGS